MNEKAILDAVAALAKAQLIGAEQFRETQSTMRVMTAKVGRLCDSLDEYMEQSNNRHADSERAIRVVSSELKDVQRRVANIEEAQRQSVRASNTG